MTDQSPARTWTWPWETAIGTFFSLSYMALVTIGCLLPLNVLDQYPQLKQFSDFMAGWNIQIRRLGEISGPANQVNRLMYSVIWCVMPIYWFLFIRDFYFKNKNNNFVVKNDSWMGLIFGIAVGFLMSYMLMVLGARVDSAIGRLLFVHQLSRSLYAPGLVFIVGVFLMASLYLIWAILTGRVVISEKKNGRK